jgi:acyl carrier protein
MRQISIDDVIGVIQRANTRIDLARLGPDADLRGIGADSLDMMTILLDVQGIAGVEVPDGEVGALQTPRAIVCYVNGLTAAH